MLTLFKEIFIWWNRQTLGTRINTILFGHATTTYTVNTPSEKKDVGEC